MRVSNIVCKRIAFALLLIACGLTSAASAQTTGNSSSDAAPAPQQPAGPIVKWPEESGPAPVAGKTELYCSGYVQYAPNTDFLEIVGGDQEQEQRVYSEGDQVFINAGSGQGVRVGQEFSVIRPRGKLTSPFTRKKGFLGVYVQEPGRVRVTEVKERVSIAVITAACESILLGDLLREAAPRVAPTRRAEEQLDRFSDPTGKQKGRIILARDAREMISRDQVVFVDLGAEDNIKAGDYFTIYRPLGTGNITDVDNEEIARGGSEGFESDEFRGGKYSNQSERTKDLPGARGLYIGRPTTTREVRRRRPPLPRKVVGELVILNVQTRTATAVITRVAQEVHTGDFVELQ